MKLISTRPIEAEIRIDTEGGLPWGEVWLCGALVHVNNDVSETEEYAVKLALEWATTNGFAPATEGEPVETAESVAVEALNIIAKYVADTSADVGFARVQWKARKALARIAALKGEKHG